MARVVLKGVSKSYGDVKVVRDVSLEIGDGELLVLVGPSGCGKTTTLRMVAGLEEITSGDLFIGDRRVNDVPPRDRDIAMVFQSYALYPHMTVAENMGFGLKLRGVPRDEIERRVREAARLLGIEEYLERKPKALSGGQRQRVAMGRAIVRNPAVFLFDEPLSNLDAKFRVTMRIELKMLQRRLKTTTLYVTHDQTEAMTLADRIAVMQGGVLRQVGTPQEVFDAPADVFVAGFIGSPAMNFLKGRVEQSDLEVREYRTGNGKVATRTLQGSGAGVVVRTRSMTVQPDERQAAALLRLIGAEVTVGVRPGGFTVGLDGAGAFRGRVDVVEHLGTEKYAYVHSEDGVMTIWLPRDAPVREGEEVSFAVLPGHAHVFGPDGKNVLANVI